MFPHLEILEKMLHCSLQYALRPNHLLSATSALLSILPRGRLPIRFFSIALILLNRLAASSRPVQIRNLLKRLAASLRQAKPGIRSDDDVEETPE